MKLIQEANIDDSFNNLLMKIDDNYEKLTKLSTQFSKDHRPVRSQVAMCEQVAEDFAKLAKKLEELRAAK